MVEAYDIGGTKIFAGVFDNDKLVFSIKEKTQKDFLAQIKHISANFRKNGYITSRISLSLPGPVENKILKGSFPLGIQDEIDFTEFEKQLGKPVVISNDLNSAVLSELKYGRGKISNNFCLVTLSTGIGVGVVYNGKLFDRNCELGHLVLEDDLKSSIYKKCNGHGGCWASLCSGKAIDNLISSSALSNDDFFNFSKNQGLLTNIRRWNARGFAAICNAFDSEAIIVMGSLGLSQFEKIVPTESEVNEFTLIKKKIVIERCWDSELVGVVGAYEFAKGK